MVCDIRGTNRQPVARTRRPGFSVAYSPNGARIISSSADIWVWDAVSGAPVGQLRGNVTLAVFVAYSPDGTRTISGHEDGKN